MVKGSAGLYYGRTPMIYFPLRGSGVSNTTLFAPPSRFGVTFPDVLPSAIVPGSALASAPRPAGHLVRGSRVRQSARAAGERVGHPAASPACRSRPATSSASPGTFASAGFDRRCGIATLRRRREFDQFGRGVEHSRGRQAGPDDRAGERAHQLRPRPLSGAAGHASADRCTTTGSSTPATRWRRAWATARPSATPRRCSGRRIRSIPAPTTASTSSTSGTSSSRTSSSCCRMTSRWRPRGPRAPVLRFRCTVPRISTATRMTNDGLHPDRPVVDGQLLPRFPFHQPACFTWDFRVAKGFGSAGRDARSSFSRSSIC